MQEINNPLCIVSDDKWTEYQFLTLGVDYDIDENGITDLRQTAAYVENELSKKKIEKLLENTNKAKQAIENGYIVYKEAQFETNAQTVGDLTATMLILEASSITAYPWLSRDDISVELTIDDISNIASKIAEFKNTVWNEKYISFKEQIIQVKSIEELDKIEVRYD